MSLESLWETNTTNPHYIVVEFYIDETIDNSAFEGAKMPCVAYNKQPVYLYSICFGPLFEKLARKPVVLDFRFNVQ